MKRIINAYPQEAKDLEFIFITNKNEFKEHRSLIEQSPKEGEYLVEGEYIILYDHTVGVHESNGHYSLNIDDFYRLYRKGIISSPYSVLRKTETLINEDIIPVHYGEYMKYYTFEIPEKFKFSYIAFMIYKPTDEIIGFYQGNLKKGCSTDSYIEIRDDFTGRGYCKLLAGFSYCSLAENGIKCIKLVVASKAPISACRCYIEAARTCDFEIYWEKKEVGKDVCSVTEFRIVPYLKLKKEY